MKRIAFLCLFIFAYTAFVVLAGSYEEFPVLIARANGTSMYPTIHDGDVVVILRGAEFGVGDIVTFDRRDRVVAHRVIGIYAHGRVVETKGDNLDRPDGYCWREDITGKVVLVGPWWILFAPQMAAVALGVVLFSCNIIQRPTWFRL